jgi:hypothetical protein
MRSARRFGFLSLAVMTVLLAGVLVISTPSARLLAPAEIDSLAQDVVAAGRPFSPAQPLHVGLIGRAPDLSPSVGAAPAAQVAAGIVLSAADLGPEFVLVSSGETIRYGVGWRVQTFRRSAKHTYYIEPDGVFVVRSLALVAPDPGTAEQVFEAASKELLEGAEEVPLAPVGQRARAAVQWGEGPFSGAGKIVIFRVRAVVGYVIVGSYQAPTHLDDILPLAQTMAARAGR